MRRTFTTIAGAVLALAVTAAPAHAQLLTFVAATGADGRPCTVQSQPCRTLDRAIDATTAGGEIRLLSSLPNQTATIDKSLTVDGAGHTMIGAITINSASAVVTLRDLSLNGRNANAIGIDIVNDTAVVHIENCTIERYTGDGISVAAGVSTEVFVSDSVSRGNADGLVFFGNASTRLTVDNSRFENNAANGLFFQGGSASVSRSVFSGSVSEGIKLLVGTMKVTNTIAAANGGGGFAIDNGEITIVSSVARGNGVGLIVSFGATARIADSVFTNNDIGVENSGSTVLTLGNNLIAGNTTDDVDGTLTPLAAQ